MNVRILLFGVTKEIVGSSTLELDISSDGSVESMLSDLKGRYPAFEKLNSLMVAVNSEYASGDLVIRENDEVALIPPVSGG